MTFAVLCPGQGAQHPALLDFVDRFPDSVRVVEDAADALDENPREWLKSADAIYRNSIAQPLIAVAQFAQWAALRHELPAPVAIAGYSVGELACYGVGGGLEVGELARVARARAKAMDAAAADNPGGLIGVHGLTRAPLQRLCDATRAYISIAIADDTYVIGGSDAALARIREHCQGAGAKVTELRVGIASHTPLLTAAAEGFRNTLERSTLSAPSIPVVAGVDAMLITTRARAIQALSAQISHTIEWAYCLDALHERGCRVFLELAPGRALSKMVRERFGNVEARSVDEFRELTGAARWAAKKLGDRS
jgi:[acyl-carrier-protein] S-malonyltransferase